MADVKEKSNVSFKNRSRLHERGHILKKRKVQKVEHKHTIIYVSTKSSLKGLLERCSKLIAENENEIIIYCLGASIQRGICTALQICDKYPGFQTDTNTITTDLTDDLEPAAHDEDYEIQKRCNSALRIRVYKPDPLDPENISIKCFSQ